MPPLSRQSINNATEYLQTRVTPLVVMFYLILAFTICLITPVLFFTEVHNPFLGAFTENTLVISSRQPMTEGAWGEAVLSLVGYQVKRINNQPVETPLAFFQSMRHRSVGDVVQVDLVDASGSTRQVQTTLIHLPANDQVAYFVVPYFIGLIYILAALYVFVIRRFDPAGRAFVIYAASTCILLTTLFDAYTTNYLPLLWTAALAMIGGGLVNMGLLFPDSVRLAARYPFLSWTGYLVSIILAMAGWFTVFNQRAPWAYQAVWGAAYIYAGLAAAFFLIMIVLRYRSAVSPIIREQAWLIFLGAMLTIAPLGLWLIVKLARPAAGFSPVLIIPLAIFPLLCSYAIIRYRLLHTDFLVSRTVLYILLTSLMMVGYGLVVSGLSLITGGRLNPNNPLVIGLMVFLLAMLLNPARHALQGVIDRYFFRGQMMYREIQQAFGRELTQTIELADMVSLLRRYIDEAFSPVFLHIFLYDSLSGQYLATEAKNGRLLTNAPTSDVRFSAASPLVQAFSNQPSALFLPDMGDLPRHLLPEQARLILLAASLFVPLPGREQLIGWIALGSRRSGAPYSGRDLNSLEALAGQAALAVERAQVVDDLERRMREMNVLARVAQGVSFTMAFDDILELISTQTAQIMPAKDFRITLLEEETGMIFHVFFLEADERINQMEHKPLAVGQGLEIEVISSQRAILTDDYERECRSRGLLPTMKGVFAWMGVPLNAGARTIGAISVATRDPAEIYTEEQRNLLQAIADQTSGAIIKARALEESERRARQLAKLNEIGVGLTSTLDIKLLMNQILHSAVDILNCEAGSLFLVDEQTEELVFEVVIGPVAGNLVGQRLPKGKGLVGQALEAGRPIIANDVKRRKEWFEQPDEQTGFETQDLLVAPMRIQDRAVGVIEVINKKGGAPFTQADQDLLMAFTSQATIAIENARLYTLTDKALTERVEELSVMQRIDRELNAGLDVERAMRITLDWAMRQSKAAAGLVGTVDESGMQVMVAQGFTNELDRFALTEDGHRRLLPLSMPALQQAIESGQPHTLVVRKDNGHQSSSLLKDALVQMVVPLRRETSTVGVLLLETTQAQQDQSHVDIMDFLTRLGDHASIAIANARLYSEVQEANLAKSRFVSFVAHELKNPMASIKGYTELVVNGMAGPINEMQTGFLTTVRSNVDRMNTIVTDLNDLTKIQVGNMRLEYQVVRLPEVLDDVIRSIRRQVEEKQQGLKIVLPEDLPSMWADPLRLTQILTNLVSNAHKYTPENGSFDVCAEAHTPSDGPLAGSRFVHIWVRDTGIGISKEEQKNIFQQYFRTDNAKEMASGTGLGLSITRSLVEMMGGRIWFESESNQGTTFHVTIPVAEAQ